MSESAPTGQKASYVLRRLSDLDSFRSVCGYRKSIFTPADSSVASLSFLDISDSSKHYHKRMTELYYCLSGRGRLELDDEEVELGPGTAVLIPPGTRHTAKGDVEVLIVSIPPLESEDVFFD